MPLSELQQDRKQNFTSGDFFEPLLNLVTLNVKQQLGERNVQVQHLTAEIEGKETAVAVAMALIAVLAVVALVVIGLAGAWLLWVVFAWAFFGRHGGRFGPWGHSRTDARALHRAGAGARAPRGRTAPL